MKESGTKDRILVAAMEMASKHGILGLTVGTLAKELQLSRSGVFGHFKSKEQLQIQKVLDKVVDEFRLRVWEPARLSGKGQTRLESMFNNWLHWVEIPYPAVVPSLVLLLN